MKEFVFHPDYRGDEICRTVEKDGVAYLRFKPYEEFPFLVQGFSTRLGGVSEGEFASMNLSYLRGDDPQNVDKNYELICAALGIEKEQLVFTNQIHETKVSYADGSRQQYAATDALITDRPGVVIVTSYADCVPLYFVDPTRRVIGCAHSGWRGTRGKIGIKTVEAMSLTFGSRAEDMVALIGPSICKDCYEVSREVVEEFSVILPEEQLEQAVTERGDEKYQLDLWKINRFLLLEAGLREENIHIAGLCTCCNSGLLFSHRASRGHRGNLNAFLGIR